MFAKNDSALETCASNGFMFFAESEVQFVRDKVLQNFL